MGKVKNVLVVLLTAVLLVGGSLLPAGAARFQDKTTNNVVQYENIEALQLRLEEEVLSMSYPDKMALVMHGVSAEISNEKMKIKEERIMEAVHAALTPYTDLFFGAPFDNDYFDNDHIKYYPVMVYALEDPSRYAYYWHVILSLDMSINDTVSLLLDDETGKALAVELVDPEMYINEAYLAELQESLASTYFNELDLEPVAQRALESAAAENYDAAGISVAAVNYQFADVVYGEVNVEIGVRTDGFHIYLR